MKTRFIYLGLVATFIVLIVHLVIMDGYGLTWDFHHHFFAGLHFLHHPLTKDLTDLPFTTPDPRLTFDLPFGPIMSITPTLTYTYFFEQLKLLAFDNAYNIAIIFMGVAGIFILFLFLLDTTDIITAIIGFVFLALLPRYFADLHNNMKDVPQAAAFALAIWMTWRLVNFRKIKDLILAGIAFAVAFNMKVNTLVVPLIAIAWWIVLFVTGATTKLKKPFSRLQVKQWTVILSYVILAPLLALLVWSFFWPNPLDRLLYLPKFFQINTLNIEVLYFGRWYCSGINVPWHYPLGYLAITTPIPVLIAWCIGFVVLIKRMMRRDPLASLLILWFFAPIARYVYPKMGVIDGIRHFEEVVFPLAAIAAIGASQTLTVIRHMLARYQQNRKKLLGLGFIAAIVGYLLWQIVIYHPYQMTYYNEFVGGSAGAMGKFDLDYWGSSQKQAIRWINEHAKKNATIHIVMAADVATKYLRPDLRANVDVVYYDNADYVVFLNRESFFYRYSATPYLLTHNPVYTVANGTVPLVWVFDNKQPAVAQKPQWWTGSDPCIRY